MSLSPGAADWSVNDPAAAAPMLRLRVVLPWPSARPFRRPSTNMRTCRRPARRLFVAAHLADVSRVLITCQYPSSIHLICLSVLFSPDTDVLLRVLG